jgi:hypothetical protein
MHPAALKGPNNRRLGHAQAAFVAPFQGFVHRGTATQGGASRPKPLRLPWAGMLRPFGAEGRARVSRTNPKDARVDY